MYKVVPVIVAVRPIRSSVDDVGATFDQGVEDGGSLGDTGMPRHQIRHEGNAALGLGFGKCLRKSF